MQSIARALLIAGVVLAAGCDQGDSPADEVAATPGKGVDRSNAGRPAPEAEIKDSEEELATLADAGGAPLLVNIWATWCAPCVKELPTLEALSRRAGAPRVIAVSQDIGPRASVEAFLEEHKVAGLETWHDPGMKLSDALGAQVLPTTVYYDAKGREVWRYVGDLDWTGAEAARLLAEAKGAASRS